MNIDELQKKVNEKRDEIEEIVVLRVCQLQRYRNIPHERPMAAINNLHSYYRQSLNFVNDFIEVDYLYRIKHIFYCIEQYINRYAISRYAQVQVPLTYKQQQHQQSFGTEIHRRNSDSQWDSIEKVKEDIHRAVSRKGGSITGSPSRKVKINFNEWHYDKRSTNKLDIRVK